MQLGPIAARVLPWPFSLLEGYRQGPWLAAGLSFLAMFSLFAVLDGYWPDFDHVTDRERLQLTGLFGMYTILVPYLFGMGVYAARRSQALFDEITPHLGPEGDTLLRQMQLGVPQSVLRIGTVGGVILACFNVDLLALPDRIVAGMVGFEVALYLGPALIWLAAMRGLAIRIWYARMFQRAGQASTIDLFDRTAAIPFARHGLGDVLLVVGALAMTPLQALDAQFRIDNYAWALIVALPALMLMVSLPLYGLQQRRRAMKAERLKALEALISRADRSLEGSALEHLNALLTQRQLVWAEPDWPLDLGSFLRLAGYIVLVPIAWAGAAFVEMGLTAILE